ncbi:MAG: M23 family metallopeptidase [Candidatus Omnitrophota bacterium]
MQYLHRCLRCFRFILCLILIVSFSFSASQTNSTLHSDRQVTENQTIDNQTIETAPPHTNPEKKYRWPLDIDNGFSSTFQEYRTGHFHAGFDLRTFQKCGYPVYATADGYIYKIRMAKRGTGRSVFLKHDDGYSSIYFHLQQFNAELEQVVQTAQRLTGRKYFGYYTLPQPVSVKKGQVIAYSGETGAGFPHLHFEIRNEKNVAINPFKLIEFPSQDTFPPIIKALILKTRGSASVNGAIGDHVLKFVQDKADNCYYTKDPLIITGNFDAVLEAYDMADTGRGVAPYEVSVFIDNIHYYCLTFDRFQHDDNNQLGFAYDISYSSSVSYFYNLFYQKGFNLEHQHMPLEQILGKLGAGKHELKIKVKDFFNNESIGVVSFDKIPEPELEIANLAIHKNPDEPGNRIEMAIETLTAPHLAEIKVHIYNDAEKMIASHILENQDFSQNKNLILEGIPADAATMDVDFYYDGIHYFNKRFLLNDEHLSEVTDIPVDVRIYRDDVFVLVKSKRFSTQNLILNVIQGSNSQLIYPQSDIQGIYFHFKPAGSGINNNNMETLCHFIVLQNHERVAEIQKKLNLIYLKDGEKKNVQYHECELSFDSHSVYEPKTLRLDETQYGAGFPVLSRQVNLSPNNFLFLDNVTVSFKATVPNPKQVGIFKCSPGSRNWRYVNTRYDPTTSVYRVKMLSVGTYALMRDIVPPGIRFLGAGAKRLDQVERLLVKLYDRGKGLNDSSVRVWINGKRACMNFDWDFDPEYGTYTIRDLDLLRKGKNVLRVKVWDNAGNSTVKVFTFKLR